MSAHIEDDAVSTEPEPLNPHDEYIARLCEIRDRNTATREAVDAYRERIRNR